MVTQGALLLLGVMGVRGMGKLPLTLLICLLVKKPGWFGTGLVGEVLGESFLFGWIVRGLKVAGLDIVV